MEEARLVVLLRALPPAPDAWVATARALLVPALDLPSDIGEVSAHDGEAERAEPSEVSPLPTEADPFALEDDPAMEPDPDGQDPTPDPFDPDPFDVGDGPTSSGQDDVGLGSL